MTIKIINDTTSLCVSDSNNTHQTSQYLNRSKVSSFNSDLTTRKSCSPFFSSKSEANEFVSSILSGRGDILLKDDINSYEDEDETFVDDDLSFSSYESSTISIESDHDRRKVQFAEDLITEIRLRPRTPEEDISTLFYSYEETQRFRREYRLEKKLKLKLERDANLVSEDSLELVSKEDPPIREFQNRNNFGIITRVVVQHNDSSKTFYVDNDSHSTQCGVMELFHDHTQGIVKSTNKDADFFDNDSFWSGSITWY